MKQARMIPKLCWMCDSEDVVYIDVFDLGWCAKDFNEVYLGGADDPD